MDLPQVVIPETLYQCIIATLCTAVICLILTTVFNFWHERSSKANKRP